MFRNEPVRLTSTTDKEFLKTVEDWLRIQSEIWRYFNNDPCRSIPAEA